MQWTVHGEVIDPTIGFGLNQGTKVKVLLQCTYSFPVHGNFFVPTYYNVPTHIGCYDNADVVIEWMGHVAAGWTHCSVERYIPHPVFYWRNPDHEGTGIVACPECT